MQKLIETIILIKGEVKWELQLLQEIQRKPK
jgi:hypothetical protein